MADGTMRREKLQRLGDDIIKVGCTAYLSYQERLAARLTDGKERHTFAEWAEMRKGPTRKKWDAVYYRRTSWARRRQDESLMQYFKRGLPALFFLNYRDLNQAPKKILWVMIPTMLAGITFPVWGFWGNEVPLPETFIGESAATVVFSLQVWVLLIGGSLSIGFMVPTMLKQIHNELRAGIFWREFFATPKAIARIAAYPIRRAYRYDRRFVVKPVVDTVTETIETLEPAPARFAFLKAVSTRATQFATRYRSKTGREEN